MHQILNNVRRLLGGMLLAGLAVGGQAAVAGPDIREVVVIYNETNVVGQAERLKIIGNQLGDDTMLHIGAFADPLVVDDSGACAADPPPPGFDCIEVALPSGIVSGDYQLFFSRQTEACRDDYDGKHHGKHKGKYGHGHDDDKYHGKYKGNHGHGYDDDKHHGKHDGDRDDCRSEYDDDDDYKHHGKHHGKHGGGHDRDDCRSGDDDDNDYKLRRAAHYDLTIGAVGPAGLSALLGRLEFLEETLQTLEARISELELEGGGGEEEG
jgi:hypothetical protein